jgi:uncharacterized membrane protein YsdA (DUF1294 family)
VITFFLIVIGMTATGYIPVFVPVLYLIMSGITIFAYAFDKSAAMNRRWRTEEQTLHVFELFGGWPGALLAQRWFRHKSRKAAFQASFWTCSVFNVAMLVCYVLFTTDLVPDTWLHR